MLPGAVHGGVRGETGSWTGSDLWHPLWRGEPLHTEAGRAEVSLLELCGTRRCMRRWAIKSWEREGRLHNEVAAKMEL